MKNIAIIGSTSAVGIYLKKELEKENNVIMVGREAADVYYDVQEDMSKLHFPDAIDVLVCLFAIVRTDNDESILELMNVNVNCALKMCMKAKEIGVKQVVFLSSIYAELESTDVFYSYYSLSKQYAEKVLQLYCQTNDINLCILKPSQIYGDSNIFRKNQPLIYTFVDKAMAHEDIYIYGRNDALKNLIYIDDVISVINGVIESEVTGTYNVVNEKNVRLSEIAQAAIDACCSNSKVCFLDDKPSISDNAFMADNRIYKLLQLEPITDIQVGMNRVVVKLGEENNAN